MPLSSQVATQNSWSPLSGLKGVRPSLQYLARDGVSREVPCSALKGETVPDMKRALQQYPTLWEIATPSGDIKSRQNDSQIRIVKKWDQCSMNWVPLC